jgi:hypothetical protein
MAENAKVTFTDKHLEQTLEQVRGNREEAAKFAQDPQGYLQAKGIDTTNMKFGPPELSETDLEQVAGGMAEESVDFATVCASVGGGGIVAGCVSVG